MKFVKAIIVQQIFPNDQYLHRVKKNYKHVKIKQLLQKKNLQNKICSRITQ